MSGEALPSGWVEAALGDVVRLDMGQSPDGEATNTTGNGLPLIGGAADLREGEVVATRHTDAPTKVSEPGDLILCIRATIGKLAVGREAYCLGRGVAGIRALSAVHQDFVRHFLVHSTPALAGLGTGSTFVQVDKKTLTDFGIPVPPLPEQRRIVAKLDELRARSRKAREALDEVPALLDKLKQSVLAAAFRGDLTAEWRAAQPPGSVEPASVLLDRIRAERRRRWEQTNPKKKYVEPEPVDTEGLPDLPEGWCWSRLEDLTPADASIVYGIIQPGPHMPDGVPFVRPADIKDSKVVFSDLPRTSPEIAEDYRRAALEPGDVVFSIVGTIGKWIIAGEELRGANITQSSVRLRPARPLTPLFFVYVLAAPVLTAQIHKLLFGNAVQRLNVDHVRKLVVPVPPTAEWSAIEAKVSAALEAVGRLKAAMGSTGSELGSLDQSILAKAFRGELVPQDPNDEPAENLLTRIKAEGAGLGPKKARRG